ncbi:MAG: hypothetical protein KDA80_00930 [Planctomycetaceae bacterium]|nr:hypothetical protein [Planctomycetaceae bacterium]
MSTSTPQQFILIPGRTSRQGTGLNEGKYSSDYLDEINTLQVSPADMESLGLVDGDRVRVWNEVGEMKVAVKTSKGDELPRGILFISYGPQSCHLMNSNTHGTGMPDSKGMDVWLEPVAKVD